MNDRGRIKHLDLLRPNQRRRLKDIGRNPIPLDPSSEKTLSQAFAAQASRTPEAAAVEADGRSLSYRELRREAGRLATFLNGRGVVPGDRVVVAMHPRLERVTGLMGTLEAGAIYVPLDVETPPERFGPLLEEIEPAWILADETGWASVSAGSTPVDHHRVLLIRGEGPREATGAEAVYWEDVPAVGHPDGAPSASPGDPAYIAYTSGSTGAPKGIVGTHRGIVHFCRWLRDEFQVGTRDRVSQLAVPSFDASLQETFLALLSGSTLVLVPEARRRDPAALVELLVDDRVTICHLVPTLLGEILRAAEGGPSGPLGSLRLMVLAGEALSGRLAREWLTRYPVVELVNLYGATEGSLANTFHRVTDPPAGQSSVSIGAPIPHTEVLLLDEEERLVLQGQVGEIYLRTPYLALGYYKQEDDPAAPVFCQNPLHDDFEDPVFRTGDLGIERRPGDLRFVGREDTQVKIRGNRVELTEVEIALELLEDVDRAVVSLRPDARDEAVLVAFYTSRSGRDLEVSRLRSHLRRRLREYTLPGHFVRLSELPITPTGKIDRHRLPSVDLRERPQLGTWLAPRTETERKLVELWRSVLGLERVGVRDTFFDLGGHSLTAFRMVNQLAKDLGVRLHVLEVFQHPTIEELARCVEEHLERNSERCAVMTVARIPYRRSYELSRGQQRLWFLWKLFPESAAWGVSDAVSLEGRLELDALRQAFRGLVARHSTLRTVFEEVEGLPGQVLLEVEEAEFLMEVHDVTTAPMQARTAHARQVIDELDQRPFDPTCAPLFRAHVLKISDELHWLYVSLPHILTDGWSMRLIARELGELYSSRLNGNALPGREEGVRYVDFAHWQNRQIADGRLAVQEEYWLERLEEPRSIPQLPTDWKRPARSSSRAKSVSLRVDAALRGRLDSMARANDVSLFMITLSGFLLLLNRLTGDSDLTVLAPVAERPEAALEKVAGFFVNLLPIRVSFSSVRSSRNLVQAVRTAVLGAIEHHAYPFDLLVEKLAVERDFHRHPVSSLGFSLQTIAPGERLSFPGIRVEPLALENQRTQLDLLTVGADDGRELSFQLIYNPDLHGAATIERFADQFLHVLDRLASQPDSIEGDEWLTPHELRLLEHSNETSITCDLDRNVIELFEEQVSQNGPRTAVSCEHQTWTYRELGRRVGWLAEALGQAGVRRGDLVGLFVERGSEMVLAMLGAVRFGASYLPLNPGDPLERLRHLVLHGRVGAVLTTRKALRESLGIERELTSVSFIVLDELTEGPDPLAGEEVEGTGSRSAYVLYTSGSTGKPKGVEIAHAGIVNLAYWMRRTFDLDVNDRVLQFSASCYDAHVFECFPALTSGCHLHILPEGVKQSFSRFVDHVAENAITAACLPTAFFRQLATFMTGRDAELLSTLRLVWVAGECLDADTICVWRDRMGDRVKVVNAYGPTESTVCATWYDVPLGRDAEWPASIPIGRPIDNTRVHVLDQEGRRVPVGGVGELYIESVGLAKGYWGEPDLTRDKFLELPLKCGQPVRVYRTGDFVRVRPSGDLEFRGRRDQQVKVRGMRVELDEIVHAMRRVEGVQEAVVLPEILPSGVLALSGYYTCPNEEMPPHSMRAFLLRHLPAPMIPSRLHRIDEMPITPSGKLDRQRLPSHVKRVERKLQSPRSGMEKAVAAIWRELLLLDEVYVSDHFLDVGGHSLLGLQVIARLEKETARRIPVQDLLFLSLGQFAARLELEGEAAE